MVFIIILFAYNNDLYVNILWFSVFVYVSYYYLDYFYNFYRCVRISWIGLDNFPTMSHISYRDNLKFLEEFNVMTELFRDRDLNNKTVSRRSIDGESEFTRYKKLKASLLKFIDSWSSIK